MEIDQLQENDSRNTLIILTGQPEAFCAVNRTLLWAAMYKIGIPIKAIQKIAQGRQNTTPRCKEMGTYGEPIKNNVGGGDLFQRAALRAMLFIIYLDDMMEDYQSLNDKEGIPRRLEIQPTHVHRNKIILHNPMQQRGKAEPLQETL